jgi:CheY-like chemotaxis protein
LVAKILVADDNSNIQKMVVLALKGEGIDVVTVGNGEAAVRKISDVRPDLVLADVFMPVRNGYEVCKYVKDDSKLSHIPVILLVGAFDPLDEQEAQRVGADGVLKKPFVPPDPLISMVRSALSRAGVSYSGATPSKGEGPEPIRTSVPIPPPPKAFSEESEPFHEPVSKRPAPLQIDSGSQPLAFGSLLETPDTQTAEDNADFVTPATSGLMPERDWGVRHEEEEVPEDEEEHEESSWRRSGAEEFPEITSDKPEWHGTPFGKPEPASRHTEQWIPTKEKTDFAETAQDAPVLASIPEIVAPAAPFAGDSWTETISRGGEGQRAIKIEEKVAEHPVEQEAPPPMTQSPAAEIPVLEPLVAEPLLAESPVVAEPESEPKPAQQPALSPASGATHWYSVSSSPWDSEVQKASHLAATWDTDMAQRAAESQVEAITSADVAPPPSEVPPHTAQHELEPAPLGGSVPSAESSLPPMTAEAIREETAQVVEETVQEVGPAPLETVHAPATETNLDDVVAKVLARMSPEVLQAVTREILKPVVEAMVRDELNKK